MGGGTGEEQTWGLTFRAWAHCCGHLSDEESRVDRTPRQSNEVKESMTPRPMWPGGGGEHRGGGRNGARQHELTEDLLPKAAQTSWGRDW